MKRVAVRAIALLASTFGLVAQVSAGIPFPPLSTCSIAVTQNPLRTQCLGFDPVVVRLTPSGSAAVPPFDRVEITVRVRDANDVVVPGAAVLFSEQSGIVNIVNGGATTATTDAEGLASVTLHGASGHGRVALCADGVQLCNVIVRSPDVSKGSLPQACLLGTTFSSVSGSDISNPACGFIVKNGSVTVGVNDSWDLTCDGSVNGFDINGVLGKGGVIQYFGDAGTMGTINACAP